MAKFRVGLRASYWVLILCLAMLGVALIPVSGVVLAQDGEVAVPSDISADEVNLIARELWCPLCSGVRLDSCELKACQQMKDVIAIKLSEGEDLESIRTYFVDQYGPQVLGEPPLEGFNWLAWILPFVVLALGGYILWTTIRNMSRSAPTPVPATATSTVGRTNQPISSHHVAKDNVAKDDVAKDDVAEVNAMEPVDEYEAKLAEELKRYE